MRNLPFDNYSEEILPHQTANYLNTKSFKKTIIEEGGEKNPNFISHQFIKNFSTSKINMKKTLPMLKKEINLSKPTPFKEKPVNRIEVSKNKIRRMVSAPNSLKSFVFKDEKEGKKSEKNKKSGEVEEKFCKICFDLSENKRTGYLIYWFFIGNLNREVDFTL